MTEAFSDVESSAQTARPVLVVDDSRAHRRLLSRSLQKWGYETIDAESGEAALEICKAGSIELVVSDWIMPGMSGIEFCRAFREMMNGQPAYFILLTAQTEREVLAEGLESGADDFLSKPFSSIELRARLRAGERVIEAQRALESKNAALSTTLTKLSDAYDAIDRDLNEARKFQEGLVPDRELTFGDFDISMLFQPSGHIGGDLVGWFRVNELCLGVYSVDVSGHGVASALMTARIASYLSDAAPDRNIALRKEDGRYMMRPLTEVCEKLNELLQRDSESDQYLTMTLGKLCLRTGTFELCQAGHPFPVVQRADGAIEFLQMHGTPIGLIDDAEFSTGSVTLNVGDRVMLYSDGITECADPHGNLLDEDGLKRILESHEADKGTCLVGNIVSELEVFSASNEFADDLSAVLIERR
ncbi:MAG: SpoIIE family protein phosphatase [Silicimonas sp.]|nr:SpoIIE family protein phosphatase [Silicimonas sp.]